MNDFNSYLIFETLKCILNKYTKIRDLRRNMNIKKISITRLAIQIAYVGIFLLGVFSHNHVMLFITITAILLGPIFCGWMCFMGLYQDICRYIGKFIKKEPIEINEKFHAVLKYSRYIMLVGSIFIGGLFLFPGKIRGTTIMILKDHVIIDIAFYCFILFGIFSLFTKRFFCRYFCVFGAKLGLFSLLRPITITRNKKTCISCKNCSTECLMHIEVDKVNNLVNPNCINCLKCVECCPKKSLTLGLRNYLNP